MSDPDLLTPALRWVVPPEALVFLVPSSPLGQRRLTRSLAALPPGQAVVLLDDRPGSRRRLRALARRAGLSAHRELVALPRLQAPLYVLEDVEAQLRWFTRTMLTVPPGVAGLALPAQLAIGILRGDRGWRAMSTLAPGRVMVGVAT